MAKKEEDYVTMAEVRRYQKEGLGMPPMEVILAQRATDLMEAEAAKEAERVDPDHFDEVDPHGPEWHGLDQSDCF